MAPAPSSIHFSAKLNHNVILLAPEPAAMAIVAAGFSIEKASMVVPEVSPQLIEQ